MDELDVRIVKLEPMRVICVNGYGASPEEQAWNKIIAWAKAKGLEGKPHRYFGYNHPDPSKGSPNYGYDVWMTVDDTVEPDGEARLILFPGGQYAVTSCKGVENIYPTWKRLAAWFENSAYRQGHTQWLEEHLGALEMDNLAELRLDLYFPIAE